MSFGSNIQFMRKLHDNMTQEELAEKLNVSRQTISKWEMDNVFPEMEKAIAISRIFNCTLDDLMKEDLDSCSKAFSDIRVEKLKSFHYTRYAVISAMPEDDATKHLTEWTKSVGIKHPEIIGWDFPFVSQEQKNVFFMHGYCAACILPDGFSQEGVEILVQPEATYAAITITNPFENPFSTIPDAYKTLLRYIEVNGYKECGNKNIIECFEKEYQKDGVTYLDVYIIVD